MRWARILGLMVVLAGCHGERPKNEGPTGDTVPDFAFLGDSTVVVGALGRFIRSDDGGESWSPAGTLEDPAGQIAMRRGQLEAGVDQSLWALYRFLTPSDTLEHTSVALSRDCGGTFEHIASGVLSGDYSGYWELLVERRGADPLLLEQGGQLWAYDPSLAGTDEPVARFGVPIPRESQDPQDVALIDDVVECNDALIATGSYQFQSYVWTSADSAATWTELPDSNHSDIDAIYLACDGEDELWALGLESGSNGVDNVVYRYEFDDAAWITVAVIPNLFAESFAAHGGFAYVTGLHLVEITSFEEIPPDECFVYRVDRAGNVDRLGGTIGAYVYRVRVDNSGVPWVAGSDGLFKWNETTQNWDQVWP